MELIKAFSAVTDPLLRRRIVDLVRAASGSEDPEQVEAAAPVEEEVRVEEPATAKKAPRARRRVADKPWRKQWRRDRVPV